ncbi:LOW QUALITY PROTEIN: matrilin-2 [Anomaloglossus baeobatrachus]|uniref:LOW QUALITY PROTEIN: matrilin-2 n=1 Tax=Anomaloglossus baeobatrachus TaxID=238106 RepID=UPI003F4FAB4C
MFPKGASFLLLVTGCKGLCMCRELLVAESPSTGRDMGLLSMCIMLPLFFLAAETVQKRQSRGQTEAEIQANVLREACHNKPLDLVFIIDSSRSVRPYDFEKVKEFLITVLKFLDIGQDTTRVGLLQYGSTVKNEFSLKTYKKKSDIERAVKRMMHLATGTMTGLALQYAMNIAFSETEGARPVDMYVPRIAMIVTDGRPQDPVSEISAKARNSGILIFAIGVGRVDMQTLKSIGSEPHDEHVFLVANFSQIETLTSVFQNKLCAPHLCSTTTHGCDHFCINTPGSYLCRCKQGYVLNADEKTCRTEDLCATEKHGCEQICVNTLGSYLCQCYEAYKLARDGKSCTIVDYCALGTHGCQHECLNSNSSYVCQCRPGFLLNPDKKTCRRPDYCALSNHGCEHDCVNTDESYNCKCRPGHSLNGDKKTCTKINYCSQGNHGCEHECVSMDTSFLCKCHKGYALNRNGKTCRKVDHCSETNHGCQHVCTNTDESYTCRCYEGFVLSDDKKSCRAMDHCALNEHGCEHLCVNAEGSYVCQCFEGYFLRDDKKSCQSKDVCKSTEHGCEHLCVNNEDSYICKCFEGHLLADDGKKCKKCGEGPVDLVFVIDGSKSLGEDNFELVKQFVNGILDSLEVSQKAARVGLVQYSTHVRTEFTMAQYSSAKDMKKAVSQMKYMGRGSMTGLALKLMYEKSFSEAQGVRRRSLGVPRVAIVFTDGRAQDEVSDWASRAKQSGITIYAVGVGKAIDEELQEIASSPQEKHVIHADDFSSMGYITEKLKSSICDGWTNWKTTTDLSNQEFSSELKGENSEITVSCSMSAIKFMTQAEEKSNEEQCQCKNIMEFQYNSNEEVRRLTQQLQQITQRMEELENRVGQR